MRFNLCLLRVTFLAAAVLYFALELGDLHQEESLYTGLKLNERESANVWRQPEKASEFFPVQIGEQDYHFNFARFSPMLARVKWGSNQLLFLDAQTKYQLERMAQALPPDLSAMERARLDFLIQKSIPGKAGMKLTQLLHAYVRYTQLLNTHFKQVQSGKGRGKEGSLAVIKQLQATVFGQETASVFFKRDNIRMGYLIQRRILTLDNSLSDADKQMSHEQLQQAYLLALAQLKES
ncbi:lipase secretion chaperone [uncultured Shewanella sp.]|uniref:lipase secretion chaperone n=1 Tax=uncultured Shewanella sp. TaxID=173975 RepID=UPI00261CD46C|nr:lipase secretion chaperone [uncultured Shewanella sp.]